MGKSISKYQFQSVQKGIPDNLSSGVFIWMLNAHKRPPHFVISIRGKVFGISLKGPSISKDHSIYQNLVEVKRIPTLFIEFQNLMFDDDTMQRLENHIKENPLVSVDGLTCLDPICFFLEEATGVQLGHVEKIFDLLDVLKERFISSYSSFNLPVLNNDLLIDRYTKEDIIEGILKVQRKYAAVRE